MIATDKIIADFGRRAPPYPIFARILSLVKEAKLASYNNFLTSPAPLGVQLLTIMEVGTLIIIIIMILTLTLPWLGLHQAKGIRVAEVMQTLF